MHFEPFDVVTVPFPFTDKRQTKKRPAVVLSNGVDFNQRVQHTVLAMITSTKNQPWPFDVAIGNLKSAGLPAPSLVRMKLFTLDNRFIAKVIGSLSKEDRQKMKNSLLSLLNEAIGK